MAEKLLILEQVNIFVGDADPEDTNHVKLQSLGLPALERAAVSHLGGGAVMGVNWTVGAYNALEPSFKLAGFTETSYKYLGIGSNESQKFTAYGVLRNKQTGAILQAKAVIQGIVGKVTPDSFDRASAFGHDHGITEVTHYQLTVDGTEWFYLDYFTSTVRQFGNDENQSIRVALGIE
ncbi:phage major tail tube protein [Agrobacterium vitis]|uniref:phage major tail tube protein n=1 Tax=Agrobacterium vitis TaxID=373 RepID=UPI0008724E2F|nr:phage major tail tube protein [Agrobacterium vitis]MUO69216.1 phage tail protein [Agrobacterium vitis]